MIEIEKINYMYKKMFFNWLFNHQTGTQVGKENSANIFNLYCVLHGQTKGIMIFGLITHQVPKFYYYYTQ